jgi:stalled ribosome alternative rescue factor ArfA
MKRDNAIQKSFRKEINLQTQIVKDKKSYTRKMKHKQRSADDRIFTIESCAVGNYLYSNTLWENNAA